MNLLTQKEKNKIYYQQNRQQTIERAKKYYHENKEAILERRKEKEKEIKKDRNKRNSPQLSCTLDEKSISFLKDMALFFSMKKRKVFNLSESLRIILKYAKQNEHELQDFI